MAERLSDILTIRTQFNFFKSIVNLEPFDLKRLEAVVNDLLTYLNQVENIFIYLKGIEGHVDHVFEWLSEGNAKFYDIYRNIDSIDAIVLQALNLLENNIDSDSNVVNAEVFDNLDKVNENSLNLKQNYLLPFKTRVDIAVEYNEISTLTMDSINQELEHCLKKCFKIHEKRMSSPVRHAPSFNLEMLTKKLLQQRSNLRLPLLNEIDNELYEEYLELKTIVDPLKASLNFIPLRIEEFGSKYKTIDQSHVIKLDEKYKGLVRELAYLQNEVKDLKYDLVDSRWNEIFSYLNTEMSFLITGVEKELVKMDHLKTDTNSSFKAQILKRLQYTTKIVEDTFILINQAIDENLIEFKVTEKSNELADAWLTVKSKIPIEFLEKIENDEQFEDDTNDMTKSFKTLSIENRDTTSKSTKRDNRRSRAGQFLMGKMNLQPVLIEGDPTSVKKPEALQALQALHRNNNNVLTDSFKPNQADISPSKKPTSLNTSVLKIPALKSSLSIELKIEDDFAEDEEEENIPTNIEPKEASFSNQMSIIEESPVHQSKNANISDDESDIPENRNIPNVFQTPIASSKRSISNESSVPAAPIEFTSKIPSLSKIPVPENFQSRIPRPSSRVGGVADRPGSSTGVRPVARPSTALGLSRNSMGRPPSRTGANQNRHSMIPQTPVRSSTISRRRTMLPQPTPIKEIMDIRSETRHEAKELLATRSESRLEGRRSALGSRTHLYHDKPGKPQWK